MENPVINTPVLIYTEDTPNPESLKFVVNRMLFQGSTADFKTAGDAQKWSPLATEIFALPYVRNVYICNNFITVTKDSDTNWEDIKLRLKEFIKKYLAAGNPVIDEAYRDELERANLEELQKGYSGDDVTIVQKIMDLIENVVKPAVANDGGNIEFRGYDQGVVTVSLHGSCSGCPSATITLKSGIEGMLKRMIPEVREVVSLME